MNSLKKLLVSAVAPMVAAASLLGGQLVAHAQFDAGNPTGALNSVVGATDLEMGDASGGVFVIVGRVLNIILGLLGIVFFGLVLYAGWLWMTAQGNGEQVEKAQKIILQGAVGILLILSAAAISNFVVNQLLTAAGA
jgi:hypothetical protein